MLLKKEEAMNIQTILVPTDFSACSAQATEIAQSLARESGARIILLHVLEPVPETGEALLAYSFEGEHVKEVTKELNEINVDPKIQVERKLLRGATVDQIVDTAAASRVDLIILGTHGRRWLSHVLLGSVAEAVVRRAECPVLTVKKPAGQKRRKQPVEQTVNA
jgi:nucleotide-binding universal stress UspA family protein